MTKPVIAVFAHSHPFYSKGGGEIVAYNSFKQMVDDGHDAHLYCAINEDLKPGTRIFYPEERLIEYADREFIFPVRGFDNFVHMHNDVRVFEAIAKSVASKRVNVFHFHHFWNVGTDLIVFLMNTFSQATFVITLHEMLAICYRDGQMVKTGSNALCTRASDIDCHLCFPQIDRDSFRMRREFFHNVLRRFDLVTAPSEFLAERLVAWGLAKDVYVLENGYERPAPETDEAVRGREGELVKRFAFFGQPTAFKGINVFVAAASRCQAAGRSDMHFAVYGCDRETFLSRFGEQWSSTLSEVGSQLQFYGPYEPTHVAQYMRQNGWIVVPSIWWENSPLVIQEAFLAGRPPIVSNIGGMREKVKDGKDGFHFVARNPVSLAEVMMKAADAPQTWLSMRAARQLPPTMSEMNSSFFELYRTVGKREFAAAIEA